MFNKFDANILDIFNNNSLSYISEDNDNSISGKPVSDEIKENSKLKGILGKIGGIGADANEPTRNGRRYPLELWQNVEKSEYFIEGMKNRTIIGEADHPNERLDYSVTEGAVVLTKYEIQNDGRVYTEFDILDTLPGRTVKTYFDAGCKLGVSSRGLGEEIMKEGEKIIDPETYQFYCFDVVAFPAVKSARMELIESTSPKRQTLINSIKKEINNCKSLDECLFIESISKDTDLYLDEIRECLEIKKEEFNINNCDNPEAAYNASKELLDEFEKLGPNKTKRDIKMIDYLKNQISQYENPNMTSIGSLSENIKSRKYIDTLIKSMEKKIDEYNKMGEQITQDESDNKILLQKMIDKVKDLRWNDVDSILNEDIQSLFNQLKESVTEAYVGKTWNEIIDKLKADGYDLDSAYHDSVENEETILMYKNNKTYEAKVNKYFDGGYEILFSTIKEVISENTNDDDIKKMLSAEILKYVSDVSTQNLIRNILFDPNNNIDWNNVKTYIKNNMPEFSVKESKNNKIKISEVTKNSDEDTPEDNVKSDDNKLQILAELQENIKNKTITIKNLMSKIYSKDKSLKEKQNVIKTLSHDQHTLEESLNIQKTELLETKNELNSLSKKYENLQKINLEFEGLFKNVDENYKNSVKENFKLKNSIRSIKKRDNEKIQTQKQSLDESLELNNRLKAKEISINESLEILKKENESLLNTNKDQLKLLEQYKTNYKESLDKYIESTCIKYNIKQETLIRLLGENYTFEDVDKVAKELADNISKVNALPFKQMRPQSVIYNENVGLINNNENDNSKEDMDSFTFMLESKK